MTVREATAKKRVLRAQIGFKAGRGDATAPKRWQYRGTLSLVVYSIVTLFLAIGAVNSQNNMLFWAFGLAIGAVVISGIVSETALYGLRVRRRVSSLDAGSGRVGEAITVTYTVIGASRWVPGFALEFMEDAPDGPGGSNGSKIRTTLPFVQAGGQAGTWSVPAHASWVPGRRGVYELGRFEVETRFPFGLLRKSVLFEQPAEVVIGPATIGLRPGVLPPAPREGWRNQQAGRRTGIGEEMVGLREYVSGDSPRLIAWRPTASSGELVVRQMATPAPPRLVIDLRRPAASTPGYLWERAISIACEVASRGLRGGWSVTVLLDGRPTRVREATGEANSGSSVLTLFAELPAHDPSADSAMEPEINMEQGLSSTDAGRNISVVVVPSGDMAGATARGSRRGQVDHAERDQVVLAADEPDAWLAHAGPESGSEMHASLMPEAAK